MIDPDRWIEIIREMPSESADLLAHYWQNRLMHTDHGQSVALSLAVLRDPHIPDEMVHASKAQISHFLEVVRG